MMRKRLQLTLTSVLSILFLTTALYSYRGRLDHLYELTFLSNFLSGLFLLGTAAALCCKRKVPEILFLDVTMLLVLVLFVCTAFTGEFDFQGTFLFLHLLNPLFMAVYFFVFCDMNEILKGKSVLSILIMPAAYPVFAGFFGRVTGNYIYFFLDVEKRGYVYCIMFVLILTVIFLLLGYGLFHINKLFFRVREK